MRKLCRLKASVAVIVLVLSVGCAPHPAVNPASQRASEACQTNVLLQKFHCSIPEVTKAAEANDADAQYALGYMFYYGINTPADTNTAMLWMRRAAAQAQPQAMQALELLGAENIKITPKQKLEKQPAQAKNPIASTQPVPKVEKNTGLKQVKPALGGYSIQLAASVHFERLKEYVALHHLKGEAGYYQNCIKGTTWYTLIYGHYDSLSAANAALKNLPAALKAQHPWVKSYKLIEQQVAQGKNC